MTTTEVLRAGRELDQLVATKVFGYAVTLDDSQRELVNGVLGPVHWSQEPDSEERHVTLAYSTDIAAAWTVIEQYDPAYAWILTQTPSGDWHCCIYGHVYQATEHQRYDVYAKTAPEAICLAALKAVQ